MWYWSLSHLASNLHWGWMKWHLFPYLQLGNILQATLGWWNGHESPFLQLGQKRHRSGKLLRPRPPWWSSSRSVQDESLNGTIITSQLNKTPKKHGNVSTCTLGREKRTSNYRPLFWRPVTFLPQMNAWTRVGKGRQGKDIDIHYSIGQVNNQCVYTHNQLHKFTVACY